MTPSSDRPAFIDPHTDVVECYGCRHNIAVENVAGSVDVSNEDEYYPRMKPLCPRCAGGEDDVE